MSPAGKGEWFGRREAFACLYWAVDATGATLDCMPRATRDADAAERFFRKV
jgi:transposase-like protein